MFAIRSVARAASRLVGGGKIEPPFDPKSLFENGGQGFWLDRSDLSTMFQDAAGRIPVTGAGQPVGLMLDKSKGLVVGSNLVRNGDFSDGATSWVARANTQLSIVNGRLRVSAIASGIGYGVDSTLVSATVASKMYRFSAEVYRTNTPNPVYVRGASNTVSIINTSFNNIELGGSSSLAFVVSQTGVVACEYFEIDNVSIKEITGSHAYQTTSSARPLLHDNVKFDSIDDVINVMFESTLTGCTLVTVKYSEQAQILDNQTINQAHIINEDFKQYLLINRALTTQERSQVTDYFNKIGAAT